jgi:hypothetical protein
VRAPFVPERLVTDRRAKGSHSLRYEDVAQDGRVILSALPPAMGEIVFRSGLVDRERQARLLADPQGAILPILTRLYLEATEEEVGVEAPLEAEGALGLAHAIDDAGAIDRVFLEVEVGLRGRRGRTHVAPRPGDGTPVEVGRVFAEHVFTRPWAAPSARRVVEIPSPSGPLDLGPLRRPRPLSASAELPTGARPIDAAPALDPQPIVFGLAHTDANLHVNSLAYVRLFEEAFLRRLVAIGESTTVLARWIEIAYRKPCFAGDRMRIRLQAFARDGEVGATGAFVPEADPWTDRPHVYVRIGAR